MLLKRSRGCQCRSYRCLCGADCRWKNVLHFDVWLRWWFWGRNSELGHDVVALMQAEYVECLFLLFLGIGLFMFWFLCYWREFTPWNVHMEFKILNKFDSTSEILYYISLNQNIETMTHYLRKALMRCQSSYILDLVTGCWVISSFPCSEGMYPWMFVPQFHVVLVWFRSIDMINFCL